MTDRTPNQISELSESQLDAFAAQLASALNGVPLGQALYLLTEHAPRLLKAAHVVDITTDRFRYLTRGAQAVAG